MYMKISGCPRVTILELFVETEKRVHGSWKSLRKNVLKGNY